MNRVLYTLLIVLLSISANAANRNDTLPSENTASSSSSARIEESNVHIPSHKLAPQHSPNKKPDGIVGLVVVGLIFFWFGLSLMILAGILALLLLGGLVWFLIGLLFFLLGIIFWSIARQKRRENKRERRKEQMRRRRRKG